MNVERKSEYIGALGVLLAHVAVIALLILVSSTVSRPDEKADDVSVMTRDVDVAYGSHDPPTMVDAEVMPGEVSTPQPAPEVEAEQEMVAQTEEETVTTKPKTESEKEKPEVERKPEKTAEEKTTEVKKLAKERTEYECKAAAEAASKRVANAFGEGSQMGGGKGSTTSGEGAEGNRDGNLSTRAKPGVGGYGTFDLGGRSIGGGGLPRPVYNVQEEGRVVVSITVNPVGHVIATSINRLTNTVNSTLRKTVGDAAKKARFNVVDETDNQTGAITYYFNLK